MQNDTTRYQAVLFDFDGTLADSYPAIAASVNYIRQLRGHEPLPVEEVKRHVGRGPAHLLTQTIPGTDLSIDLDRYRAHHPTVMFELTHLLPGAATTLSALHRAGRKVALCSNKPRLFSDKLLAGLGIGEAFTTVIRPVMVTSSTAPGIVPA